MYGFWLIFLLLITISFSFLEAQALECENMSPTISDKCHAVNELMDNFLLEQQTDILMTELIDLYTKTTKITKNTKWVISCYV